MICRSLPGSVLLLKPGIMLAFSKFCYIDLPALPVCDELLVPISICFEDTSNFKPLAVSCVPLCCVGHAWVVINMPDKITANNTFK